MTENREPYVTETPPELPSRDAWSAASQAFEDGFAAGLRFLHRALFLEDWPAPMNAYALAAKIRAACLAGELGGEGEA